MRKKLTNTAAVITIITSMLGPSIYFMPYVFGLVGYTFGSFLLFIISIATFFSLYCISYCTIHLKLREPIYSALAAPISKNVRYITDMSVSINSFTAVISLYRYLTELITKIIVDTSFFSLKSEILRKFISVALLPPLAFLSSLKDLSELKYTSFATIASVIYLGFLMIGYYLFIGNEIVEEKAVAFNSGFSLAIPYFITALACQSNMVKIQTELENRTLENSMLIGALGSFGGALIYGSIGLFGYKVFGGTLDGDVLSKFADSNSSINKYLRSETLDKYNISSRLAVYGCIIIFLGCFPIQLNPIINSLHHVIPEERRSESHRTMIMFLLISVAFSLVLIEDLSIGLVISIAGATITNVLSFFFPFLFFLHVKTGTSIQIVFAVICMFLSTISAVYMVFNIVVSNKN